MKPRELCQRLTAIMDAEMIERSRLLCRIESMLGILYPHGINPRDYGNVVLALRVIEALCEKVDDSTVGARDGATAAAGRRDATATERDDGVVHRFVEDKTEPVTPRALAAARRREERPWRRVGSFRLSDYAGIR